MDPVAALRWQRRDVSATPWLHEEVASRMVERLKWFREPPSSWMHWEPVSGGLEAHRRIRSQLPDAPCHVAAQRLPQALDATRESPASAWNPLKWGRGKSPQAASEATRVRMLWANMALHMEPKPQTLLKRWNAHIETDGFLMFSCLGPDSLRELRAVYAEQGWPAPSHAFTDMHDWGDMLVHSGFAEPVMDMERITLSYSGAEPLLAELRGLGRNLFADRFTGCRSRHWRARLLDAIEASLPRAPDGRLLLTFEIIYGHAFKPVPRVAMGPSTTVPMEDMRAMLRGRKT
ncbi:biotin synthase [Hydrogenophaga sp. BPS33]|uniref:biotin synthase n=1 Tax=Hydrogenophaga sp. BPS33 TaxID=2651974 RepID=UPI00131FD359|nr:biotin synthase [Hydrogenophaga sp. BPS33]QHE89009.1 biotin synthase [Hydrogenophaga sp. BPS33]